MKTEQIRWKKLTNTAKIPTYGTVSSARFDLYASEAYVIYPGGRGLVRTGLAVELPTGHELQIVSRSGMALKHGVIVLNAPGIIDEDYRDEVGVVLINHGSEPYTISPGDRVAQAGLMEVIKAEHDVVETLTDPGTRKGGFGHTGV